MKTRSIQSASKKWLLSVLAVCSLFLYGAAQNGVAINTTGAAPDASAILDLSNSVSKGFLLPRLSTSSVSSPATGLMVYQTAAPAGIYCNVGTPASPNWILLSASTGSVTSVGMTVPSGFSVSPATITSSGTFAVTTSLNGLVYGTGSGFSSATVNAPLAYSGGVLGITQAGSTTNGYLSSTDWNTFNSKISGNQPISLTGDVTGTGTTSIPVTLATVNSNVGTFNTVTVNAKGLVTAASNTSYQGALNGTGYVKQSGTTTSYVSQIPLTSDVTGILPIANGGTGANSVAANVIFAGPSGAAGAPSFRLITAADIPAGNGNYIQNGTAVQNSANFNISGAGVVGNSLGVGGALAVTGNSTLGTASNGVTVPKLGTAGGVVFSTTGGGVLGVTAAGTSGQILTSAGAGTPTWATTLPIANGGTNATTLGSAGSVIYSNGTQQASTAVGTTGQVLTSNGTGAPTWSAPSALTTLGQSATTVYGSGPSTLTSTTYVLIPGLTQTITIPSNSTVLVATHGGILTNSTSTSGYSLTNIALAIDGAVPANGAYQEIDCINTSGFVNIGGNWALSLATSLSAGSHKFEVYARIISGTSSSSATVSGSSASYSYQQGALTVTILKN